MEELGDRFSKPRPAPGSVPSAKVTRVRALADLVHYTQAVRFVSFSGRDGSLSAFLFFHSFHEGFAFRFVSCALPPGTVSDVAGELMRAGIMAPFRSAKTFQLRSQLRLICHVAFYWLTNGTNPLPVAEKQGRPYEMSSFPEGKALKRVAESGRDFVLYNTRFVLRLT
jgi:hypothetical protein